MRLSGQALLGAAVAALVAALVLPVGPAGGIPGGIADPPADGFDHIAHQGRVVARAVAPPPCSRCHRSAGGRLVGVPGHASCFGDCHGPPPARPLPGRAYPVDDAREKLCHACHRPAHITRLERGGRARVPPAFPPYDGDRDFALTMSHAAHAQVERGCLACHAGPPEPGDRDVTAARARRRKAAAPHTRCASCHERSPAPGGVAMDRCSACHAQAVGPSRGPRRDPGAYPVRSRFSHRRHLPRVGGRDQCRACHGGVMAESGELVPTPRKEHCRPCHDGKRAFSLVAPACRRCHGPPDREVPGPLLQRSTFSHRAHAAGRPGLACTTCHALDARGAPVTALRGHAPCADAGCHDQDFAAAVPVTCGVCHVRAEPWRDQHADPTPADTTEFGAEFSHRAHLAGARPRVDAPCTDCHRAAPDGRFQGSPGHATCAGPRCHGPTRGAAPRLSSCSGCHVLGLSAGRERSRNARRWSVRQRFSHAPHATEPGAPARPLPCTECHARTVDADRLADIPPPRKQACARCHDGRTSFKLTGHTCARCHVPAASSGAAPPR
jgi:c(7)-type cytochrome triheme protein